MPSALVVASKYKVGQSCLSVIYLLCGGVAMRCGGGLHVRRENQGENTVVVDK